jgi:hypothetical protein
VVLLAGYGLWRSHRPGLVLAMLACAVLSMFPMALLNHVGELYVYNTTPFVCVLLGMGLGALAGRNWRGEAMPKIAIVASVLLLLGNIAAAHQKMRLMYANGNRTTELIEQIRPYLANVPPNGRLVLVNPPTSQPEYSVFLVNGFNQFRYGTSVFNVLTHRWDFGTDIIDDSTARRARPAGDTAYVLGMEEGVVRPYREDAEMGTGVQGQGTGEGVKNEGSGK